MLKLDLFVPRCMYTAIGAWLLFSPAVSNGLDQQRTNLGTPLWQLGEFYVNKGEFQQVKDAQCNYAVANGTPTDRPIPIPQFLGGSGTQVCHRLRLTFPLDCGVFALVRSFKKPEQRVALVGQVFFNGRELACYFTVPVALPRHAAAQTAGEGLFISRPGSVLIDAPAEYQCAAFPFVCLKEGPQELSLSMEAEANNGERVELDALAMVKWQIVPRPHSLTEDVPGRVFLDAWGWMGTAWYQRTKGGVDQAYFDQKIIAESADRGSNYLQLHPSLDQSKWSNVNIDPHQILRSIHDRDMLVDEHCFPPKVGREPDGTSTDVKSKPAKEDLRKQREARRNARLRKSEDKADSADENKKPFSRARKGSAPAGEERDARNKLISAEPFIKWFREGWAPLVADFQKRGWRESVDGFEGEAWNQVFENPAKLKEAIDSIWRSDPGLWVSHASFPTGALWLNQQKSRPPNYLKSPVCLNFLGIEVGSPEGRVGILGYDDKCPVFHPFPACEGLHIDSGRMYLGYQADCRMEGTEIIRKPSRVIGGGSTADWVLKQVDDFFRSRARWPDDPHETAIWWLGEPLETLPLEFRDYVYAITQDPIKRALAATLAHDGVGGFLDQRRERIAKQAKAEGVNTSKAEWWKLRPRSEFPASTHFLQTSYLRLNLFSDRDGGVLQYDLERLAHFDSDGLNVPLTEGLITAPAKSGFKQTLNVQERGGHWAVLQARAEWNAGPTGRIVEDRRYSAVNDASYFNLDLSRSSSDFDGPVDLALGTEGYDQLIADGRQYDKNTAFHRDALPMVWALRDSHGVKPDLVVLVLDKGKTSSASWTPNASVKLIGSANDRLKLAWVVPTDLYAANDLPQLAAALKEPMPVLKMEKNGAEIHNRHGVPYVAAARIENSGARPYLVQENGWWTVRGAQRSLREGNQNEYLKLYLPKDGTTRVVPYATIDGVVKPGYGCQYVLALRDITGDSASGACTVRVLSVTPFIFASRVEFAKPIASVELNGRTWRYFDPGAPGLVFLPNEPGNYQLKVRYGPSTAPVLIRTFACIRNAGDDMSSLQLEAVDPPWVTATPADFFYYAFVRDDRGAPSAAEGATILSHQGAQTLIRFRPGRIRLTWPDRAAADPSDSKK